LSFDGNSIVEELDIRAFELYRLSFNDHSIVGWDLGLVTWNLEFGIWDLSFFLFVITLNFDF
jgi:hypothetical protein